MKIHSPLTVLLSFAWLTVLGARADEAPIILVGALTAQTAEVRVLLTTPAPGLTLQLQSDPAQPARTIAADYLGPADRPVARFALDGLTPNTAYHYQLARDHAAWPDAQGAFRTFPAGPASFTFAVGSCWQDIPSAYPVFSSIQAHHPLFFLEHGDLHYSNFVTTSADPYRKVYREIFAVPTLAALVRTTAFNYMWDDHDVGPNDADRTSPSVAAVRTAYRETFPHYPLAEPDGGSVYHAFSVGRARFIVTDCRTERTPGDEPDSRTKTMLGARQKTWFKQELLAARDRGDAPIFWISTVPFLAPVAKSGDNWGSYATERTELADFIKAEKIPGVIVICGDAHMIAADDGRGADYATGGGAPLPVFHCGPLSAKHSFKGGPKYSHGAYLPPFGQGSFGVITVEDSGQVSVPVKVRYSGRRQDNVEILSCELTLSTNR